MSNRENRAHDDQDDNNGFKHHHRGHRDQRRWSEIDSRRASVGALGVRGLLRVLRSMVHHSLHFRFIQTNLLGQAICVGQAASKIGSPVMFGDAFPRIRIDTGDGDDRAAVTVGRYR